MTPSPIIDATIEFVKSSMHRSEGGHDWWHIYRVWQNARHIAEKEGGADELVVELGALLHDIADAKFHDGDEAVGPETARAFLQGLHLNGTLVDHVGKIVEHVSFRKSLEGPGWTSRELEIVQDADRLDAIGAIGIARAFSYGGHAGRALFDPTDPPQLSTTGAEYKRRGGPTINHFHEKLLLLKDRMNTATGRAMAAERHEFMKTFLNQFHREWP